MSLVLRLPREIRLCRSYACQRFWNCYASFTFCSRLAGCRIPCACHKKRSFNVNKVARTCDVFSVFTSKCASRHNGMHFFDIWTCKSAPKLRRFAHFNFEMCSVPQKRALFPHAQLPKVLREWCVLYVLTWTCASRHNGVHFFISHPDGSSPAALASLLFDPLEPQIIGKQCFATFLPFRSCSCTCIFFHNSFSSLILPTSAFQSVHIVGSLTSKLPSGYHLYRL